MLEAMEQIPIDIDIINVAGLLMNGQNDGLEKALHKRLTPRSIRTIAPTPLKAAMEHPDMAVARAISMIQQTIAEIEEQFGEAKIMLVGRSYGAFIALLAAIRMEFEKMLRVILVEGPLHPDVLVEPPKLILPLMLCGIHYEVRPQLAREAVEGLRRLGSSLVTIIQGGQQDDVVPLEAQLLPVDFQHVTLSGDDLSVLKTDDMERGAVITLPPHAIGVSEGLRRTLPQGYRNHLFWNEAKMDFVTQISASSLSDASKLAA